MRTIADNGILLITERRDLSADLIIAGLARQGAKYVRWNGEDFPLSSTLAWDPQQTDVSLGIGSEHLSLDAFKSVWYRRTPRPNLESMKEASFADFICRETSSFLHGIFENSRLPWMNRPSQVQRAENKLTQLVLARELGFSAPRTIVTNDPLAARSFVSTVPRTIVKSLTGGTINDDGTDFAFFTHPVSTDDLMSESTIQAAPCIFQERISKGFDIRVTVVGAALFATKIVTTEDDEVDWRAVDRRALRYHAHRIPEGLGQRCRLMLRRLGLTYGCLDFVLTTAGEYVFLEVNPSGQWGWIDEETGSSITESIIRLLIKADF